MTLTTRMSTMNVFITNYQHVCALVCYRWRSGTNSNNLQPLLLQGRTQVLTKGPFPNSLRKMEQLVLH